MRYLQGKKCAFNTGKLNTWNTTIKVHSGFKHNLFLVYIPISTVPAHQEIHISITFRAKCIQSAYSIFLPFLWTQGRLHRIFSFCTNKSHKNDPVSAVNLQG